jgi:multiple sugar transport system substrate-binding protein
VPTPDWSGVVLTRADLPDGFWEVSPDEFGWGPGEASMVDSVPIETAFGFSDDERFELVVGFTVILADRMQQIELDEGMAMYVRLFLVVIASGMGVEDLPTPKDLPDLQFGDASAGKAAEVPDEEGDVLRLEAVMFRRGEVGAFIFAMRMTEDEPGAPIGDLARTLDERAVAALASTLGDGAIELDLWHTKTGAQEALLNEIVADFNASNDYNIKVNAVSIEGSYDRIYRETVAGLATGDVPDLVVAYPSMVAEYMQAGVPLDLRPYIEDEEYGLTEEELDDIFPVYIEDNIYPAYGDQILSWPFYKSVLVTYANVTLLEEAGVTKMPETWDEFYGACKKVKQNTDAETCWSIHVDASDVDGLMASVGAYPQADPETLTSELDDPRFVEWCEFLQGMVDEGLARPEAEPYSGDDEMVAGDAAFTTSSSSSFGYFPRNGDGSYAIEWQVIPLPHAAHAEPASIVYGGNIMAVREDDPERDLAKWLFIQYWTSYEATKKWVLGTDEIPGSGYLPLHRSTLDDPEFVAFLEEHPRYDEAVQCLDDGVIEPQLAGQQAVRGILEDVYVRILNGEDAQATLQEAARRASEAFRQW